MLISFRNRACALAAAMTVAGASAAFAETHNVLIVDGAYFPPLLNVALGDNVTFTNNSTITHTISGAGDAWTSGPIGVEASFTLDITDETPTSFGGMGEGDVAMEGTLLLDGAVATE